MPRKPQKDRTSLVISVVIHVVLIGGIVFWAYKTGKLEQMRQAVLQYVKGEKKEEKKPEPVQQKQAAVPKLPPINQGVKAPESSGTRRAVASDAPASSGSGSFFQDTRKQVEGPSSGTSAPRQTNAPVLKQAGPATAQRPSFAPLPQATVKQLMAERAKAAAAIESFGAEQIGKSSVKDAGEIVSRVSGATVVEGQYAVIRGLTDRYSAATLNGAELPSADPYRRSAALNMFPSKIIDRVTVTKTFTPDQPGSYTGGNINIVTKSFPEKAFASMEIGASYNTQTTGNKNFAAVPGGGSTDWLGMDDGSRKLPEELWGSQQDVKIPSWVPRYGRINKNTPGGRVDLGNAMEILRLTELGGTAPFAPVHEAPPPAHNFVVSAGDTAYLFERPIGVFASLPYNHTYGFYDNGTVERVTYNTIVSDPNSIELEKKFTETKGVDEVNWAGTASIAFQPLPDHQIGYNFIFNQYSENQANVRRGEDPDNNNFDLEQNRLIYTERNLTTHQFRGDHLFPELGGFRADWLATFSDTSQDQNQNLYYVNNNAFNQNGLDPKFPSRFFQELRESNQNLRFDFAQPFHPWDAATAEVKFGYFRNGAERNYRERILRYDSPSSDYTGDPNGFLTDERLGVSGPITTNGNFVLIPWATFLRPPTDHSFYTGNSDVDAGYLMTDFPLLDNLRLIGGARLERTDTTVTAFTTTISEGVIPGTTNTSSLKQNDLLPAVGLVWSLTTNMNIRLNYGETIARPSFRELAPVRTFDLGYDTYVVGNPDLTLSAIKNYDLRWEWFARPGEIYSVGLFYKDIKNVIEKEFISATGDIISFVNRPEGKVYGVEMEARRSLDFLTPLWREWTLGGNLALIKSEQNVPEIDRLNHTRPDLLSATRPLADQSPYILNLDLTYDNPRWGTTLSFNYNIFGPRLLITSLNSPDVYEQPSAMFDITVAQRIGRNMRLKFAARNLLNPEIKRTYGKDEEAIYSSNTRGRTFSLSLAYDF